MSDVIPSAVIDAPTRVHQIVLGAPGSGKTELLQQRFLALVEQGVHPDNVLVATPTRHQASHLRDVLGLRLGQATQGARVRSLAALAFSLLESFHRQRGLPAPDLMKASQIDLDIQALLTGHEEDGSGPAWPEMFGPEVRATRVFRQELREWIARAGENGATSDEIHHAASRLGRPEWAAASDFREEYRRVVASARPGAFDSGEIFARATAAVREGLPQEFSGLAHLCIEDAHDLTHAGLMLIQALAAQGVGMTVVSEPDVAGNTFRGSEPSGHALLAASWKISPTVLPRVWRHGSAIRAVVSEVTARIGTAQAGTQRSAFSEELPATVHTMVTDGPQSEAFNIARLIREAQLSHGRALEDILVVARRGTRVSELVRELTMAGIPARQNMSGATLREHSAARELLELLALGLGLRPITSRSAIAALQGLYGGMTQQELRRLRFAMRAEESGDEPYRPVDVLIAEALAHRGGFALLEPNVAHKAHILAGLLADIRDNPSWSVSEALWAVWEGSGANRSWPKKAQASGLRQSGINRSLDAVVALFAQAADFGESTPGGDPAVFIEALLTAEVPEDVILPTPLWPAVLVATPSSVAGVERPMVIVSGVDEGVWPDLRLRGSLLGGHRLTAALLGRDDAAIDEAKVVRDDELRLFALAVSRASEEVIITATQSEESEPSALFRLVEKHAVAREALTQPPASARSVVGSLRRDLVLQIAAGGDASTLAGDLAVAAQWGLSGADPETWWGLAPISTEEPLPEGKPIPVSPSALASVEESPLDWFLSSIARNDPAPSRGLGLLLHQAWEHHGEDEESLWSEVDRRFGELEYDAGWVEHYERRLARGMVAALGDYTRDRLREGYEALGVETPFTIEHEGIVLRGVIDRLEKTPEGRVLVVDLKTGTPQTDAAVVDNPQMLAYQMALESPGIQQVLGDTAPVSAGAILLFVKSGVRGKTYRLAAQEPLTAEKREAFLERVESAARLIAAHQFAGEPRAFGRPGTPARHRWHAIAQVCGDA